MADADRKAQLTLLIKEAGAKETAAEIQKINTTAITLQSSLGKLSRADQVQKLGADMGVVALKTRDAAAAVTELNKKLAAIGANKDEIQAAASAFQGAQANSGNGPGGNVLQRAGTGLRNLPSVQIPGAGIGTDAIGNITRLAGAITAIGEKSKLVTAATNLLTPALGLQTAATYAALVPIGAFVAAFAVIALSLKAIGDQAAQEAKAINAIVDAQREVSNSIAEGLTTEEAKQQIEDLNKARDEEARILAKNQTVYNENIENQGALTGVLKLTSGAEEALAEQLGKSKDIIAANETQVNALTLALEDGTLAANDAAAAEKKLAEERTKATLDSAEAAGKELAAQQKALAATEEQNIKRLEAIDNERAVIERQIEVLTASGDTSEEVAKKIESLNGQLGSLGKESAFIEDTALAVSRQRDAEKKAQKDAEDAAKKAQQAQETYTKAVKSATTAYRQSVQDIGTRLSQTLADNTEKLNRDLTDIATKYKRDEYDLTIKANRAERDALMSQVADLEDIRNDALKDEQEALRDGDFKALFLARQTGAEALQEEASTIDKERAMRQQNAADAREDLLRNAERQRSDRVLGYDRQNIDARTAQQRDLQQAALTRQRALQIASEGMKAELAQRAQFWNAALQQTQQAQNQMLRIMQGGATGTGPNAGSSSHASGFASSFTAAVRR